MRPDRQGRARWGWLPRSGTRDGLDRGTGADPVRAGIMVGVDGQPGCAPMEADTAQNVRIGLVVMRLPVVLWTGSQGWKAMKGNRLLARGTGSHIGSRRIISAWRALTLILAQGERGSQSGFIRNRRRDPKQESGMFWWRRAPPLG
ncbi:hypothetical protein JM66_18245 [Aeromonas bestiarum]|nr:hypothetical protein JM66_18245 [Aeromonas bestiarum]